MSVASLLRSWLLRSSTRKSRNRPSRRAFPRVEWLEDRNLLAGGVITAPGLPVPPGTNPGVPAPPGPGPGTGSADFWTSYVTRLYFDLLRRAPQPAEVTAWVDALEHGTSPGQVAGMFVSSPEYQENLIQADYRSFLNREPEAAGVADWLAALQGGMTDEQMSASILASDEFYQEQGGTDQSWLAGLYGVELGRPADLGGLVAWSAALQEGVSREAVALSIVRSDEAHAWAIRDIYHGLLQRDPEAGLGGWLTDMRLGMTPTQLAQAVASSPEFRNDPAPGDPPPFQAVSILAVTPDTGDSPTDGLTNQSNLTLFGEGVFGLGLMVSVDGVATTRGQVNADGTFTVALSQPLAQGQHVLTVQPVLGGTEYVLQPAVTNVTVDLTAPQVVVQPPAATPSLSPIVRVAAQANDPYGLDSQVSIDVDLNHDGRFDGPGELNYAVGQLDANGATSITLPPLPAGTYQLRARVTDPAGNVGISPVVTTQVGVDPNTLMPLAFEPNVGQAGNSQVSYLAHGRDYVAFLTPTGLVLSVAGTPTGSSSGAPTDSGTGGSSSGSDPGQAIVTPLTVQFAGANPNPQITAQNPLPGKVNYLIGNDPSQWHTDIPTYNKVQYQNLYPGVDLALHGNALDLEYDFIVNPGADPGVITLAYPDATSLQTTPDGQLLLGTAVGQLEQTAPTVYQVINGVKQTVAGQYVLKANNQVGFQVGPYDPSQPLIIDPLVYGTFLGGTGTDTGNGIAVDGSGNIYVTGATQSTDFPFQGGINGSNAGKNDVYVTELNATGTALVYSTYVGGTQDDYGNGITVDPAGEAYVVGQTASTDFPVTAGVFQGQAAGKKDAFVFKLSKAGNNLAFSTYLGGTGDDNGTAVKVDGSGNVYVFGDTTSNDFPTTPGSFQPKIKGNPDIYITKLDPGATKEIYSTYVGGFFGAHASAGNGMALAPDGSVVVVGNTLSSDLPVTPGVFQPKYAGGLSEGYVLRLDPTGSKLIFCSYIGGSDSDSANDVALDPAGNIYITGQTKSTDFPVTPGAFQTKNKGGYDVFVSKITGDGKKLLYSTYLGTSKDDNATGIAVDGNGVAYVTGYVQNNDFSVTPDAVQPTWGGGKDAYLTLVNPAGSALIYSTYLGGSGDENGNNNGAIALDSLDQVYLTGATNSKDFPEITTGSFQTANAGNGDAFIVKFGTIVPPPAPGPGPGPVPVPVPTPGPGGGLNPGDDRFERNDTSDRATFFGPLAAGTQSIASLSIDRHADGLFDYDWYRWTAPTSGVFTASITNINTGPYGGGDLNIRVYTVNAQNTLIPLSSSTLLGGVTTQTAAPVLLRAGEPVLVWVYGFNHAEGTYDLSVDFQ